MTVLRSILEQACGEAQCSAGELTVLSVPVDPYRLDTPTGHAEGAWLGEQVERLALTRRIHLRGLHYALVSTSGLTKPNGQPYLNTEKDWLWLQGSAAKAARWLGYLPFDKIVDARNEVPVIREHSTEPARVEIGLGADIEISVPDLVDIRPTIYLSGFGARQLYHLVFYGEKTSLDDVLAPICRRYEADLYLPSGEISDSQLHTMAKTGAEDCRPMVVFVVADFDPAGRQMAVSIGRKLQAFRDLHFPYLEFELHPIALNEEQVRELGLPSTPLKESEKRADRWRIEFGGLEQTEVDALATLRPDALRRIVEEATAPFYDRTLAARTEDARLEWEAEVQDTLDGAVDNDLLRRLHDEAESKLEGVRADLDRINEQLRSATEVVGIDLPAPPAPPKPQLLKGAKGLPLLSTDWSWIEQTRALKQRKSYGNGGAAP
jgi:hypothetical protein